MFSRIFAFGDSFVAGDELASDNIDNFIDNIKKNVNNIVWDDNSGSVNLSKSENLLELQNLSKKLQLYHYGSLEAIHNENINLSFPNILGKKINVPVSNYASGGSSHVRIFSTFLDKMYEIEKEKSPFVIIGLTGILRNSRFKPTFDYGSSKSNIDVNLLTYVPPHVHNDYKKRHDQYVIGEMEFGDDNFAKAHTKLAYLFSFKFKLQNIPHIIIDSNNEILDFESFKYYYSPDMLTDDDPRMNQLCKIHSHFINNLYHTNLKKLSQYYTGGINCSCLYGHPKKEYHVYLAEIILNDLIGNGVI